MIQPLDANDPREIAGYRLQGRLGNGGMGSVYLSHTRGGQPVALKVVRPELAQDPEFRTRFEREVHAAQRVHGPYTAPVLDSNTEGPIPWLAGAYVAGPPLSDAVRHHGPLPLDTALLLLAGVAEALQSIHAAGVIHRDLKPSNVLLAADGPRVIDFGIARAADTTALTRSNMLVGTPAFMSPEQMLGGTVGFESDMFSLAVLTHFAATGVHPFGEGQAHALMYRILNEDPDLSTCPAGLRTILEPCLAKDASGRPGPADVIEECRRSADVTTLRRGSGRWLPAPIAEDIARRAALSAGPRRNSGASGVPPAPEQPPTETAPPSPTAVASPPSRERPELATAPPSAGGARWHRPRIGLSVLAVLAVAAAGAVFIPRLLGDDKGGNGSGGTPSAKTAPGWELTRSNVSLVIPAPAFPSVDAYIYSGLCTEPTTTYVSLESLSAQSARSDMRNSEAPDQLTLKYTACQNTTRFDSVAVPIAAELRVLDGRGVMGRIDKQNPTPDECRDAAHEATVPIVIPLEQLRTDAVLSKGMGVCVETDQKTVVLLWIDQVQEIPGTQGLRTYVTTATQWKPATGTPSAS